MSIASLSPNRSLESVPREAVSSPRRYRGEKTAGGAQWTDAGGRARRRRRLASGARRLQPGDGLGFQMMRREADEAGFPLFISRSPNPRASPSPPPALSKAHGKLEAPATSITTTAAATAGPAHNTLVAMSKQSVQQVARSKQTPHHQHHHHQHHQHKTDPPRKPRTANGRLECHACGARETPEWRCGPDGQGTLCNVCGLVLAKKQRRKSGV